MSDRKRRHFAFARLLSNAVAGQALLSAANFGLGLLLVRHASDIEYGAYVLVAGVILLLASLQYAFVGPTLAVRIARLLPAQRSELIGGLYVVQRRFFGLAAALVAAVAAVLWLVHGLADATVPLFGVTALALVAILHREYLRSVLFADGNAQAVLFGDVVYAALALAGAFVAIRTSRPALVVVAALGVAATLSTLLLLRSTQRHGAWSAQAVPGLLREIAPLAAWSVTGAAIHWSFSQGYVYLVAATLDVAAVAALAATRMLLMPVNLLSSGIRPLMLPLSAGWLHRHGDALLMRRLAWLALAFAGVSLAYFGLLWWWREWIFGVLLRKDLAQHGSILLLWGAIFLLMVMRDQLSYGLAAHGRFRELTLLTLACAVLSLAASFAGMLRLGVIGALFGVLLGEGASLIGVVLLLRRPDVGADPQPERPARS